MSRPPQLRELWGLFSPQPVGGPEEALVPSARGCLGPSAPGGTREALVPSSWGCLGPSTPGGTREAVVRSALGSSGPLSSGGCGSLGPGTQEGLWSLSPGAWWGLFPSSLACVWGGSSRPPAPEILWGMRSPQLGWDCGGEPIPLSLGGSAPLSPGGALAWCPPLAPRSP